MIWFRYLIIQTYTVHTFTILFFTFSLGHPLSFFVSCQMCFLILGQLVGKEKKNEKKIEKGVHPWSLETTRCDCTINMAAMDEGKADIVVQVKREQGKKDDPPKMHTDLPAFITFQQLLEGIVPDILHITAVCRVGFKKRGEKIKILCLSVFLSHRKKVSLVSECVLFSVVEVHVWRKN